MGGGSTSQLCPHCGSELRADTRFCRICGQSVQPDETAPVPFPDLPAAAPDARAGPAATAPGTVPLNLPDGGVAPPAWSGAETVTASAVPAAPASGPASGPSGWAPPPADDQATRYQPAGQPSAGYQPPDYQPPDYPPAGYQPQDQPSAGYQPPGYRSPDYPPPGHRPPDDGGGSRRGRIIVAVLAVIVAVGGIAAGLLIARAHASPGQAGPGPSTPAGSSAPASSGSAGTVSPTSGAPSSAPAAEQQGATNLSALLAQSGSDRGAINNAYHDVLSCGPAVSQDQATFQQAATSRQSLLSKLATMPDAAALPAGMISSLTQAWQASITADQDYAAWAGDEAASCTPNGSDANFSAAAGPDQQATTDKTAFVNSWNPIAQQYRLQTYAQDQI
jgi:hypothetical protein